MLYAEDKLGQKIAPVKQGQEAVDPYSGGQVEGEIFSNPNYWRLMNGGYDNWCLPVCAWSLKWKQCFSKSSVEIVLDKGGIKHIADVQTSKGTVVKFQNRMLNREELLQREAFFGKMIWIFKALAWDIDLVQNPKYYTGEHGRNRQLPEGNWVKFRFTHVKSRLGVCKMPVFIDLGDDYLYLLNWQLFDKKLVAQFNLNKGVMKFWNKKDIIKKYQ